MATALITNSHLYRFCTNLYIMQLEVGQRKGTVSQGKGRGKDKGKIKPGLKIVPSLVSYRSRDAMTGVRKRDVAGSGRCAVLKFTGMKLLQPYIFI